MKKIASSHLADVSFASRFAIAALVLGLLAMDLNTRANAAVVFDDDMNYADNSAIAAAWLNGTAAAGASPQVATQVTLTPTPLAGFNPSPASGQFMLLNNGVRYRELGTTITDTWTLSFQVSSSSYSRSASVFLLDASGQQGYGVNFNSANVDQFNGQGLITINKFNNSSYTDWASFGNGASLGGIVDSGHPVTGYAVTSAPDGNQNNATYDTSVWEDFLEVTLTWDSSTGALAATVDGVEVASAIDTDFSSFSTIYLRGNTSSFFDSLQVSTVPEPSSAMLLGSIVMLGLIRRRRGV